MAGYGAEFNRRFRRESSSTQALLADGEGIYLLSPAKGVSTL